ncbi:MAG: hypothetical protein KA198_00585 [Chitinophagaceae bacterium]|nr:hypothetical protein [Chitinophagaceae bacterium]
MKKTTKILFAASSLFFLISCEDTKKETTPETTTTKETIEESCFLMAKNRDTTTVNLKIENNQVSGSMEWLPYEKDGAHGTLAGTKNPNGEMNLIYTYTIEGSNQTSEEIMKIENNQLLVKKGELIDPNNDGHTKFKDAATAVYADTLQKVDCK